MNVIKLMIAILSLSVIGGCGNSEDTNNTILTKKLNVRVIDGYLFDAFVWLDVNQNGQADADEPQAWTDIDGRASLDITDVDGDITDYPVVSTSIKGKTVDADAANITVAQNYQMKASITGYSSDSIHVITPITTLLNVKVSGGQSVEEAKGEIRDALNQPDLNFSEDYIASNASLVASSAKALVQILPVQFEANSAVSDAKQLLSGAQKLGDEITAQIENNETPSLIGKTLYKDASGEVLLDSDSDGDGVADQADKFPSDSSESLDFDNDGRGDNADLDDDGDGIIDSEDPFPYDNSQSTDSGQDDSGDNDALDNDNDGVLNGEDAFPNDATEWLDSDKDGVGDNSDAFPKDGLETLDSDKDGVGDNSDAFPKDGLETLDSDKDGVGDNSDAFPKDGLETLDSDKDGVGDNRDAFPNDALETLDSDKDGVGDNSDAFPKDGLETLDSDKDGVGDNRDAFPNDALETLDSDKDGVGDNSDAFPKDGLETLDSDKDGVGDNTDAYPLDRFEQLDTNNDGWGDFASSDDDGDGIPDSIDSTPKGKTGEIITVPHYDEVLIYYKRSDANYDGWGLHLWNNDSCDSVSNDTDWGSPYSVTEEADEHGKLFRIALKAEQSECVNFSVHKASQEAPMGNRKIELANGNTVYAFDSTSTLYYEEIVDAPIAINGVAAHWLALDKLAWSDSSGADHYALWASKDNSADFNDAAQFDHVSLTINGTIDDPLYPHLNGKTRYNVDIDLTTAKAFLKKQLIVVALDASDKVIGATRVQVPFVLDDIYTSNLNDADETKMGAWIESGSAKFSLWAPTAQQVELYLYDANKVPLAQSPITMIEDTATGVWSYNGDASLLGSYFRYRLQVFHPKTNQIEWVMTTDPYSVSLSTNSLFSQLVDLSSDETKPSGWDEQTIPSIDKPEDNIIYELHVRDFSGSDTKGTRENDGKYLAFTESERDSVKHLQALKDAGLTTVHLLPTFDISSVNEDPAKRIDLKDDISKLCNAQTGLKPDAAICAKASTGTIQSILESLDPASGDAQALMADIRPLDSFNWGYDPYHYNAPEGSYAVNSDGISRIKEYRKMIETIHNMGFRVVQDVVFNHMSSSALYNSSVLDKVVPGYYHRLNADSGLVESSTCCDNTASEHRMFEKLVEDSLMQWADEYKIDGFRFDLMGHLMKSSIVKALVEVQKVDPDNWFYGEGWDFGEVAGNARGVNASSWNMAATGIGTYNDRLRDAVRGASGDVMSSVPGFANGADTIAEKIDLIRLGMTGNLQEYPLPTVGGSTVLGRDYDFGGHGAGYAADPVEAVNYVSKHDNQTLWDIIQYKAASGTSSEDRARMQIIGLAPVLLGQGVPFLHMGSELLRSKSMERDSYDSGDWYNRVDFSMQSNNWNVGLPREDKDGANWDSIKGIIANSNAVASVDDISWTNERFKEMLAIRSQSDLLHLGTTQEIIDRVTFHNTGSTGEINTIVMSIDDGVSVGDDLDPNYEAVVVAINASANDKWVYIPGAKDFELHPVMVAGNDPRLTAARVDVTTSKLVIPGLSAVVFVKKQQVDEQGLGMDVAPVNEELFLRGSFNGDGWPAVDEFKLSFKGQGRYEVKVVLAVGSHNFKIAASEWSTEDVAHAEFNAANISEVFGSLSWTNDNNELQIEASVEGEYLFELDLSDINHAKLNIVAPDAEPVVAPPFDEQAIYLRGSLTDWVAGSQMIYVGGGKYTTSVYLRPGDYQFKLASADWSTVNLKYGDLFASADGLALQDANNDSQINISVPTSGLYTFELDANDPTNQILSVKSDDVGSAVNETMMQYFHWYNAESDNLWLKVSDQAQTLADVGITALWLPPAYKAMKRDDGKLGVGYSTYDLYDLGEFDQQNSVPTKYGTKDQYLSAISDAQAAGIQIYADVVLNHKMGADETEQVTAVRVNRDDRNTESGENIEIAAWTKFNFPVRDNAYSDFKWSWYHFDGVDWDQTTEENSIFKFRGEGKAWDAQVSSEFGNYDYLMGADLDMGHPEVVEELKKWGQWYVEFAGLDGLRLDAIKHIDTGFFNSWIDSVRSSTGKSLFTVGEYWDYDLAALQGYLKNTGYRMSLFDAPLHLNFHNASKGSGGYDMGSLMNGTLMKSNPAHAVTLVENHDTQSLQSLESPVEDWFKPLAYAFILLRQEGYPNVFYADYYGASYTDKGGDGADYTINMATNKALLDILLKARRDYAYGKQRAYLDAQDVIGWTREGNADHLQGIAVLMTDAAAGTKVMEMGIANANECFVDITGNYEIDDRICTDNVGSATFKVMDKSVSVWVGGYVNPDPVPEPDPVTTISVTFNCENGVTVDGQNVYALGSGTELGNWDTTKAVKLSPTNYPKWSGVIDIPVNTDVIWKCFIKDDGTFEKWQSDPNNSFTTPDNGSISSTGAF